MGISRYLLPLALAALPPAALADDADLRALRAEVAQLKSAYEERIAALEQRLAAAESKAAAAQTTAARAENAAQVAAVAPRPAQAAPGTNAFNPDVSLILSGMYTNLSADPQAKPYRISGFVPSNGEVAPPPRSFSLGESELMLSANVDRLFRGALTFAMAREENTVAVEEAYVQTLGLPQGFTAKAGRYLSGIGYLNEQHAHAWDFSDAPLAYKAFLGGQLRGEGIQARWIAPTDTFVELGFEAGSGGGFPATDRNKNGSTLGALFAHVGGDVGASNAWRAGLSFVKTAPRNRSFADADAGGVATTGAFSGNSRLWIADAVWKWAPQGNASYRNLVVQGEYFRRREDGTLTCDDADAANPSACTGGVGGSFAAAQSGLYAQATYQFMPAWRVGYRHDRLHYGRVDNALAATTAGGAADFPILAPYNPQRNTLMLDWSPSEFSRVRLQYARDASRLGTTDNQLWLHYIVSLGAHGAHKF